MIRRWRGACQIRAGRTVREWTKDARKEELEQKQAQAWDMWPDCYSLREIAEDVLGDKAKFKTIDNWVCNLRQMSEFTQPPASLQHYDIWTFHKLDDTAGRDIFGRMRSLLTGLDVGTRRLAASAV